MIKRSIDPFRYNKQVFYAYNWLRTNKHIKNAAALAKQWELSESTISDYLSNKRSLGVNQAAKFETRLLKPHRLKLADFQTPVLLKQAELAEPSPADIASLLSTQLVVLEAGQKTILQIISELKEEIGELRKEVKISNN